MVAEWLKWLLHSSTYGSCLIEVRILLGTLFAITVTMVMDYDDHKAVKKAI